MQSFRTWVPIFAGLAPLLLVAGASAHARHVVSPGETLSYVAQVYAVTVNEMVQLNGIANPDLIFPGQELDVPGTEGPAGGGSGGSATYTVEAGDTLSSIASWHGVATSDLAATNGLDDWDYIYIGQTLAIPGVAAPVVDDFTPLAFPLRPYDPEIEALIEEFAWAYGVDPRLVKALATVESGWQQWAVSYAGAVGVMQIMPGTALWLETDVFGYEMYEDSSAYDNIKMGVMYLAILLGETGGDEYQAVASYYQGLSPTQAGVFYRDTEDYVQMIMRVREAYF